MSIARNINFAVVFATAALAMANASAAAPGKADDKTIARGRYIAQIAGCNDCHTAGYAPSGGKVPEKDWLRYLGPAGGPAPAYVPPGQTPNGPYAQFPAAPK